jgi:acetyltransferase-like isoleucine patch superfamily enzyme
MAAGMKSRKICIVGANSVVTKSFPAGSVVAGTPAKLLRTIQPQESRPGEADRIQ